MPIASARWCIDVTKLAKVPAQTEPLVITADVSQTFQEVGGVSLTYL